jgi:PadR family transcriptional regulator PadR
MRVSHQMKRVLQVLLDAPTEETYGYQLAEASGLASGSIYPILRRLEDEGWITSRWEEIEAARERRRRRYYRLTGEGRRQARVATAKEARALRLLTPGWSHAHGS